MRKLYHDEGFERSRCIKKLESVTNDSLVDIWYHRRQMNWILECIINRGFEEEGEGYHCS